MEKQNITDTYLKRLPDRPKPGARLDVMDKATSGFGVRIRLEDGKAKATFMLLTRYPDENGSTRGKNPTRRALGEYPALGLADARKLAEDWKTLIKRGIDPAVHEQEQRGATAKAKAEAAAAAEVAKVGLFRAVASAFMGQEAFLKQRRHEQVGREITRELLDVDRNPWADKHVAEITDEDIAVVVEAIRDRPAPYQAYNVLGHIRAIFRWAKRPKNKRLFGLQHSPLDGLKPSDFGLKKEPRQRVLDDVEIATFWRATGRMGYPNGSAFRLLMVTGQRKSEISEAVRGEISLTEKLLTVPPERFKSNATHMIPLSTLAMEIVDTLPRFNRGDHLFSTTNGERPINGFSNAKKDLDRRMLRALRAYARMNGADPKKVKLDPFVLHDVRRTVRTRLSGLRVSEPVAEMIIGHSKKGLERIYNQHKYLDQMREALEEWAVKLRSIVQPPTSNVIRPRFNRGRA